MTGRADADAPVAAEDSPEKRYYRIGEVSRITGVKPYVLRYWESEFRFMSPQKSRSQQRLYRRRDIELLLRIRQLLYGQRFTIEGARARLRELGHDEAAPPPPPPPEIDPEMLRNLKQGLRDLIRIVGD